LASVNLQDAVYWHKEISPDKVVKTNAAYLLPNYDEYIVSYKDRSSAIREKDIDKADPRGTIFNNTLILSGQIAGIWKRGFKKDSVEIDIKPFRSLSKAAISAVNSAAKHYAKFLGLRSFDLVFQTEAS
jgi:hypothetical protein